MNDSSIPFPIQPGDTLFLLDGTYIVTASLACGAVYEVTILEHKLQGECPWLVGNSILLSRSTIFHRTLVDQ